MAKKLKDRPKITEEPRQTETVIQDVTLRESDSSDSVSETSETNYQSIASSSQSCENIGQMRISLPKLAKACDRTGVSDRPAAIIATAVLEDFENSYSTRYF
uniref:Uncharacterized protein LOC114334341 n=1 Tax=Diabrotica virgifera virgifera TaxID=50390 RepID=A0A6P7FUP4_DIAVI